MSTLNDNLEQRRRSKVRGRQTVNGLDYVRVSVLPRPGSADPAILRLRFVNALSIPQPVVDWLPLVRIEREGRILAVSSARPTDSSDELEIRVEAPGDLARYTLSLRRDGRVLAGFDPLLSSLALSFSADPTRESDCHGGVAPPAQDVQEPEIDYLARDFTSFRRLMLDRLAATLPDWQERNPADVGIMLTELISHAAEELSYYQDAVATEAYLGTARQRISVRRHARLFDYYIHEGCNARALVCVEVDASTPDTLHPAGALQFASRAGTSPVLSREALRELRTSSTLSIFESMEAVRFRPAHNRIDFHTFSDSRPCLPAGALSATVRYVRGMSLEPGQLVVFEEVLSPRSGRADEAEPLHRYAVRLRSVSLPYTDPVDGVEVQDLTWSDADALPFSLCLVTELDGRIVRGVSVVLANAVLCDHGERRPAISLPAAGGERRYLQELPFSPIAWAAPLGQDAPATQVLIQDPREALPAVALVEQSSAKEIPFTLRPDLLHSGPRDRHFTVEINNDGRAVLRFGDGTTGRPPTGPLRVSCRVGNGPVGNLPADALAHLLYDPAAPELSSHVLRVRNPLPAAGGQAPEPLAQVRRSLPWAFRTQQRAVTESDYVAAALSYADVQQAAGRWQWAGSAYTMYLTVSRRGGRPVDAEFATGLLAHLEPLRLIGHELQLEAPAYVPLDIALTVYVKKESLRTAVQQELLAVFSSGTLPDGRRGYFHPDSLRLGASIYLSQIISAVIAVPGVDWIDASPQTPGNRFRRLGAQQGDELRSGKISLGPRELPQLANDPQRPTAGRIAFDLRGGI